jgi:uridine kinase
VSVVEQDAYYRDRSNILPEERRGLNYDHPDALELPLLIAHLRALRNGDTIDMPVYDFTTHCRTARSITLVPTRLVAVEGTLILADRALRDLMDIKVFVDTAADLRLLRRVRRDLRTRGRSLDSVAEQYLATVRPMHVEFVEPSKRYADMIIPEGGHNPLAVDGLLRAIRDAMTNARTP